MLGGYDGGRRGSDWPQEGTARVWDCGGDGARNQMGGRGGRPHFGAWREPTKHDWVLISEIIACVGVIPLALVCGPLRGIPLYWRFIDCSVGVFGVIPLVYCLLVSRKLQRIAGTGGSRC